MNTWKKAGTPTHEIPLSLKFQTKTSRFKPGRFWYKRQMVTSDDTIGLKSIKPKFGG